MADDFLELFPEDTGSVAVADEEEEVNNERPADDKREPDEIFKKWFRTKNQTGFIGVRAAFDIGKVAIDIGDSTTKPIKNTLVYTNVLPLATYLQAVASGTGDLLYPEKTWKNKTTPAETYMYYGGGTVDGKPVSRILGIRYWNWRNEPDRNAFEWKNGMFAARRGATGSYEPIMDQKLSENMIRVTRAEMAEMSMRLQVALTAYASGRVPGLILANLSGNAR